jgi:hypothetical protein
MAESGDKRERMTHRVGILIALTASMLAIAASPAPAAFIHPTATSSFGTDGTGATSFSGSLGPLTFNETTHRLYALDSGSSRVYGFDASTPGTYTPLGGFPFTVNSPGSVPDLAVDGGNGNIYFVSENSGLYGFTSSGSSIFSVSGFGDPCGAATDSSGHAWVGDYGTQSVKKYSSTGSSEGSINVSAAGSGRPCHIAFDRSNGDLLSANYNGPVYRFTATSGYTSFNQVSTGSTQALAVDATNHRVYVAQSENVRVYEPNGTLIEEFASGLGGSYTGIAIDEASGDVFVSDASNSKIKRFPGVIVPDVTTSEPTGLATLHGHVNPAGGGEVTSCVFEFSTSSNYSSPSTAPCSPAPNYAGDQDVSADVAGVVTGETLYHFRLKVGNANGSNTSTDRTFTPHFVTSLVTQPATEVTRTTAKLNASSEGTNETTHWYFNYGATTAYGQQTAIPPGTVEGPTTGATPLSFEVTGLEPAHTYHFQIVAENSKGVSKGTDQSFTTQLAVPNLVTQPATEVTRGTAKLNASYEGTNETTHWYFNYGPTTAYGQQTAIPPGAVQGPTAGTTPLAFELTGLEGGHIYHFQIVAENSTGVSKGTDSSFTTPPAVTGLTTDPPTNLKPTTVTLNGSYIGTNDATTYHFEWGPTTSYSHTTLSVGPVSASGPQTVSSDIVGTVPGNTYHYRVVASNPLGTTYGEDVTFEAPQIPAIVSQSVSNLTATSVDLNASINPHNSDTTYRFDYGTTPAYGQSAPIPAGTLTAATTAQPVTVHLSDLTPHTVYHFQVVATNEFGTSESGDLSFNFYPPSCPNQSVRQETNADSLPDCRAYELVSPEDAGTAAIFTGPTPQSPTATSPSRLSFAGGIGAIPGVGDPANAKADLYMSTRTTTGWKTRYIGLPATMAQWSGGPPWNVIERNEYYAMAFEGVLTDPSMSHIGIWDRGYYYCNTNDYATCQVDGAEEGYFGLPDVPKGHSDAPYVVNSTTGAIVDRWPTNVATIPYGEKFVGHTDASADMTHFIFTSNIPFVPGGVPGSSPPGQAIPGGNPGSMYDNDTANGTLSVVSLNEKAEPIQAMPVETSNNGSHILMTVGGARQFGTFAKTSGPGQLFMRVNDATTYDIAAGHSVQYVDMTPDGSKVYFTSGEDLTYDGSDTDSSRDLYMWSETSNSPNHITLISKGNDGTSGNSDSCNASWTTKCGVGIITFAGFTTSEVNYDRQYTDQVGGAGGAPEYEDIVAPGNGDIYFLSPEQLDGDFGVPNAENLYVYRNGKLQFVTALTPETPSCAYNQGGGACSATDVARMEITPNDEHMAFLTASQVTDYDNAGHPEIYLYTPASGDLRCTSCLPNGDPPTKDVTASHDGRFLANDGRTFFNTDEALVLQDTNQATDVYEYVDGRPQLITGGTATSNNTFGLTTTFSYVGLIGVSADGTDVYFSTTDTLVGQDRNGDNNKIYDARTGGGFPFVAPPPGCAAADECHGAGSSAPAGLPTGTRADLGTSGSHPAAKKKKAHKQKRRKRHARHKKAHGGGRRNG